jgi:integrase
MRIRLADRTGTAELKYLEEERLPSGAVRIRFRRRGLPKITLRAPPGTQEFFDEYRQALEGLRQPARKVRPSCHPTVGSLRWLVTEFYKSAEFKRWDPRTQHTRRLVLEKLCDSKDPNGVKRGDKPYAQMEPRNVRALRDEKADTPEAANTIVKVLRRLFGFAVDNDLAKINPARDVPLFKTGSEGFHSWTIEEVRRYEERHPVGTRARLALALLLYTGQRRSDVVLLGRQHLKDGWLKFTQFKNRNRNPIKVELPIIPALQAILDASPCGDLTFLVTQYGKPFRSSNSFGNKFRDWCDQAGLSHCSAHGLRKAAAARLAELGATDREIMSVTGHQTSKEVDRYTKAAQRRVLAQSAMARLVQDEK